MMLPDTYECLEERRIGDLNSDSLLLRHKKTGARVAVLKNDDNNKVFYIGFRTPPEDSTGVAHIIEHTVLCGSEAFPVKDPFIELAKGSLNTFLNAMTYPDKTVYPVASCNDADFKNLMHVYLDAVFYPNIYREEKIFRQEGWHYEMESKDDPLTVNGVVYNEMKGVYSSPDDVLERQTLNSLYPDTTYAIESGGDPKDIPDLTYENYLDFHRRYYHPSNSYIYLYGDMDVEERLRWLDENYLSRFDAQEMDSEVRLQQAFAEPRYADFDYPVLPEDDDRQKTYLAWNVSIGTSLDPKLTIAFDAIDYALCSSSGAVIKKALVDAGIGQEIYSTWECSLRQPYYSIVAKNADPEQEEEFCAIIERVIREQVEKGFDKRALMAAINSSEFKYREADFGRFPKGLLYGLQVLDSWLYDDKKPWIHIESGEIYKELKRETDGRYFEELAEQYLLKNTHRTVLMLKPKKGLAEEQDAALKEKLAGIKAAFSDEEIRAVVDGTKALRDWQEAPDAPEDLAKIPLLSRADMRREAEKLVVRETEMSGVKTLVHDVFTNGIYYLCFAFDITDLPEDLLPYAGYIRTLFAMMDTTLHSYGDLANEIHVRTGGIGAGISTYPLVDSDDVRVLFEINAKVLTENLADAFSLTNEVIRSTVYDNPSRLKEILEETRSRVQSSMPSAGHQTASLRALAGVSRAAQIMDRVSGIDALRLLETLCKDVQDEKRAHELAALFSSLACRIFRKERFFFDVTAPASAVDEHLEKELSAFTDGLYTESPADVSFAAPEMSAGKRSSEAYTTPGQVQYVALAGNFLQHGFAYTGALRALKVMLSYDYLWQNIRVKGGAYGCMSSYRRNGDAYFVSYRDPHLKNSLDVYRQAADYVRQFAADERTLTQYIIGAVSELDVPKTPSGKGTSGMYAAITHTTQDMIQRDRDALLDVTEDDIRALGDVIEAFVSDGRVCVVGSAERVRAHEELFEHTEPLAQSN